MIHFSTHRPAYLHFGILFVPAQVLVSKPAPVGRERLEWRQEVQGMQLSARYEPPVGLVQAAVNVDGLQRGQT